MFFFRAFILLLPPLLLVLLLLLILMIMLLLVVIFMILLAVNLCYRPVRRVPRRLLRVLVPVPRLQARHLPCQEQGSHPEGHQLRRLYLLRLSYHIASWSER